MENTVSDILDSDLDIEYDNTLLSPDEDPEKPARLSALGGSFLGRFKRLGDVADIDKSIGALEYALQSTPDGDPNWPARLRDLGGLLLNRFECLGHVADIDRSILVLEEALRLTPREPIYLNNLGTSFLGRFEGIGDMADLDRAISVLNSAVRLIPDGPSHKPTYLNNLSTSFLCRANRLGDAADVDRSIAALEDAMRLTPDSHRNKPSWLGKLGGAYGYRFKHSGDHADIDKSVAAHEDAIRHTPDGHPDQPTYLSNLGESFRLRFKHLGDTADLLAATVQFSRAAHSFTGPPLVRINAALWWADCLQILRVSSLEAYASAFDQLSRITWLGLPMDQHRQLLTISSMVHGAAAAAIELKQYGTALEWLERGRSIACEQRLRLRSPVDDLRAAEPALADRIVRISMLLEHASTGDTADQSSHQVSLEQVGRNHRELILEWEKLVESARALPGFGHFLRPRRLLELMSAARPGPVVVINVHRLRCDALIIMAGRGEVTNIPLERFSYLRAQSMHRSLDMMLSNAGLRTQDARHAAGGGIWRESEETLKNILSELWTSVVKPVLDNLAFPISRTSEPPRIWWCPTGPLTFLPLHAAGIYETDEPGSKISDFVISSYTPTVNALLDAQRAVGYSEFRLLAVTQPSTPGQPSLDYTNQEMIRIRQHAANLPVMSVEGVEATVERVVQGMNECNWIHLACHVMQGRDDPIKNALVLQDGQLALSEMVQMSLPRGEFAFLSACQTAPAHDFGFLDASPDDRRLSHWESEEAKVL